MNAKSTKSALSFVLSALFVGVCIETMTDQRAFAYILEGGRLNSTSESMIIHVPTSTLWSAWSDSTLYATGKWGATSGVSLGWSTTPSYSFWSSKSVMVSDYSDDDHNNAYTTVFTCANYQNTQVSFSSNWDYCHVHMNNYYLSGASATKKRTVMTHEIGHGLGLDDNNTDITSIMCQEAAGRIATAPSTDDYNGIRYIY